MLHAGAANKGGAPVQLRSYFSFEEAINAGVRMKAKRIYLTHICHDYSHQEIEEYCRNFAIKQGLSIAVAPAYDGLELEI